jgi:hypothetical protein
MGNTFQTAEPLQYALLELECCGFQPVGGATQGSGNKGRALSADGMTWAELVELRSGLSGSLRQLLEKGVLRGTGCTAQFTSEFTNGDCLVTTTAALQPAPGMDLEVMPFITPLQIVALRHMQRIDAALLRRRLRLRVHTSAAELAVAEQRLLRRQAIPAGAPRPALSPEALLGQGVPPHLAQIIAGPCAPAAAATAGRS